MSGSRSAGSLAMLGLLAVGAFLRVLATETVGNASLPHGDEVFYVTQARAVGSGRHLPENTYPPGQTLFLAAAFATLGDSLHVARLAQAVPSLLTVLLVFATARAEWGQRPALVSAGVCAIQPSLVFHTHYLWPETLYSAFLLLVIWATLRAVRSGEWRFVGLSGVGLGLATLTREEAVVFVPMVAILLALGSPTQALRRAATVMALWGALVLPWTARNVLLHGSYALVSTNPSRHLGLSYAKDREAFRLEYGRLAEPERQRLAWHTVQDVFREGGRFAIPGRIGTSVAATLALDGQLARFARVGWLPSGAYRYAGGLIQLEAFFYVVQTLLAIAAAWLVPGRSAKWLVVGCVLLQLAVTSLGQGQPRYRVPLLAATSLLIGPLLCSDWRKALPLRGLAGVALTGAAFGCGALATLADSLIAH